MGLLTSLALLVAVFTAGVHALLIPARLRVWVAISIALVWWSVFRADSLPLAGFLSQLRLAPLALVIVTALIHPRDGQRRPPTTAVTAYLWIAVCAVVFVFNVDDFGSAVVARVTWAMTILAALLVARIFNPATDVHRLVGSIALAGAVFTVICVAGLAVSSEDLLSPYARFDPWGINPNALGGLLAIGAGALYVVSQRRRGLRLVAWVLIAADAGILLLTASRGNLLILAFALLPVLVLGLRRRPLAALTTMGALVAGGWYAVSNVPVARFERLGDLESSRGEIRGLYWAEVVERPFTGLLFSDGQTAHMLAGFPLDEHNAYLRLLYLGGLALFVPVMAVSALSLVRARRWLRSSRGGENHTSVLFLTATLVGLFVYSYTNRLIYEPLGVLPFFHALLLMLALQHGRLSGAGDEPEGDEGGVDARRRHRNSGRLRHKRAVVEAERRAAVS